MPKSKGATLLAVAVVVVILLAVGWTFPTWIVLLLVIVALFMCATICHGHFKKAREEGFSGWEICTGRSPTCHLCLESVAEGEWGGGAHRAACAARHREYLLHLPTPHPIRCLHCDQVLRLWRPCGLKFRCRGGLDCSSSEGGKPIENDGSNRLSCFSCDYDLCESCVLGRLRQTAPACDTNGSAAIAAAAATTTAAAAAPTQPSGATNHPGLSLNTSGRIPASERAGPMTPPPAYEDAVGSV